MKNTMYMVSVGYMQNFAFTTFQEAVDFVSSLGKSIRVESMYFGESIYHKSGEKLSISITEVDTYETKEEVIKFTEEKKRQDDLERIYKEHFSSSTTN